MRHLLLLAAASLAFTASVRAATLTLDNSTLYGMPGDIVGFGFTLTSTPDAVYDGGNTPYLVVSSADFQPSAGSNPVGVFTPFLPNSFIVIGPSTGNGEINPLSESFNDALQKGIGSYAINSFQSLGDETAGTVVLTYDEYSVSPNLPSFDPTVDTLATDLTLTAPATVIVGTAPVATPEPGSAVLLGLAAALLGLVCRKRDTQDAWYTLLSSSAHF